MKESLAPLLLVYLGETEMADKSKDLHEFLSRVDVSRTGREKRDALGLDVSVARRRDFALLIILTSVLSAIGLVVAILLANDSPALRQIPKELWFFLPIVSVVGGAMAYLQPSLNRRSNRDYEDDFLRARAEIDKRIQTLRSLSTLAEGSPVTLSAAEREEFLERVKAKIESDAIGDYISSIERRIADNITHSNVENLCTSIADRLGREVQDQARRGNLNLILGIMTTLLGLSILGYSVFYAPSAQATSEIVAYFLPRVSLVILIEVFAYFFLRLYKQSLSEIKYFQNEITNIESRRLAIQFAVVQPDASLQLKIVEELIKTERNFLMSKDQTTIEIERERISHSIYSSVIDSLAGVARKKG